jgi:ParB-like chromosome segregation protein Spo0J
MAASIREFGFKVPILALSDGTIIDGHLRLKAAQKLKIETVPVILCDEWTPTQEVERSLRCTLGKCGTVSAKLEARAVAEGIDA